MPPVAGVGGTNPTLTTKNKCVYGAAQTGVQSLPDLFISGPLPLQRGGSSPNPKVEPLATRAVPNAKADVNEYGTYTVCINFCHKYRYDIGAINFMTNPMPWP